MGAVGVSEDTAACFMSYVRAMKLLRLLAWRVLLYGGGSLTAAAVASRVGGCSPAGAAAVAHWETGTVRRVLDGDTYEVLANYQLLRVRLIGVDAPELGQPGGREAADSVRKLLRGQPVRLLRQGADGYGRTLGAVRVSRRAAVGAPRSVSVDSLLVVRGWAWAYDPGQISPRLAPQQQQAMLARRGLWTCGAQVPVRPGIWRAFNRQEKLLHGVRCAW